MVTKIENIPAELRELKQFVCWVGNDKVPRNPFTGGNAKSNDPSTWSDFNTACKACDTYGFDGLGFMFANGYFGVDLDHCSDDIDFCDEFVDALQSYAEYSKSGNGIHIICRGKLPDGARRKGNVEMYSSGRYFICTGNVYNPKYTEIADCTEAIKPLHKKYLPGDIQRTIRRLLIKHGTARVDICLICFIRGTGRACIHLSLKPTLHYVISLHSGRRRIANR